MSVISQPTARQRAVVVLAVAALLVAALLTYVVSGASAEASEQIAVELAQASSGADEEVIVEDAEPLVLPLVTYDVYLERDPFEPVLQEAEESSQDAPPPAAEEPTPPAPAGRVVVDPTTGQLIVVQDPTPTPGAPDPSPTPQAPGGTPTTGTGTCQGEDEVVCDGKVVTLHEVREGTTAVFQVDAATYEVAVGEVFAASFRLLSLEGTCATFLYGDDTSTLCAGQRTLK